jgi:NADH-quinone oxidoreductase subunit J
MSVGAILCSLVVVSARNPVVSVLSLLGSFVCLAVIYLLAGFQFMAAAQLLVYAGAIMVLFLFVIMLLNLGTTEAQDGAVDRTLLRARRMPIVLAISAAVFLLTLFGIETQQTIMEVDPELAERGVSSMAGLAELMFSTYLLPFEAASVLLLAATIAVIVLAKRGRTELAVPARTEATS